MSERRDREVERKHMFVSDGLSWPLTCRGRFGTKQVIPNPTKRMFVRMNARKALVTFWVFLSLGFFFFSPLVVNSRQKKRGRKWSDTVFYNSAFISWVYSSHWQVNSDLFYHLNIQPMCCCNTKLVVCLLMQYFVRNYFLCISCSPLDVLNWRIYFFLTALFHGKRIFSKNASHSL